jgi:DNA-binding NarL/FixJ family response regulator
VTTLLLIEDEADLRESLATSLGFEGFVVHTAATGASGLEEAQRHRPDLIVCDIQMPGMDGFEVLAKVRSETHMAQTPFIFLTARGEKTDLRQGMISGADDYLVKPVALDELLTAIRVRLERFGRNKNRSPNFSDAQPLETLGLSPKQAETLLWVAQGKSNAEVAAILKVTEGTVKKHLEHIFAKLGVEKRGAASLLAIEHLSR